MKDCTALVFLWTNDTREALASLNWACQFSGRNKLLTMSGPQPISSQLGTNVSFRTWISQKWGIDKLDFERMTNVAASPRSCQPLFPRASLTVSWPRLYKISCCPGCTPMIPFYMYRTFLARVADICYEVNSDCHGSFVKLWHTSSVAPFLIRWTVIGCKDWCTSAIWT